MRRRLLLSTVLTISLLVVGGAAYGGAKMLFCLPGFPGTSASAQPYVDKMLRYLESKLDWEQGSATGLYLPDGDDASKELLQSKPDIALVGPSIYAAHSKELKMKVIAKVEVNGHGEQTYSVVTSKQGPATLLELSGKTVEGAVVHDQKYVYNVILDKKVDTGSLTLKSESRPLRALRNVVRGKAGGAIVDDEVIKHMASLPFADELQVIFTSKPVPAPAAVVMNGATSQIKQLKEILIGMCAKEESRELCKTLTLTSIKPASDEDYKKLLKTYNR